MTALRHGETELVVGAVYRLPSQHLVRVVGRLHGGDLDCRYVLPDGTDYPVAFLPAVLRGRDVRFVERFMVEHADRVEGVA